MAVGWWHTCASDRDMVVQCWGLNHVGQCDLPGGGAQVHLLQAGGAAHSTDTGAAMGKTDSDLD